MKYLCVEDEGRLPLPKKLVILDPITYSYGTV